MLVGLSRRDLFIRQWIWTRIGHTILDGSELPQVTGLALNRLKIVRVFEFMSLTSAPGRIRTCAHGSGEGCCTRP
jgi:hypothetical protein